MKKLLLSLLIIVGLGGGFVIVSVTTANYKGVYQEFVKNTRVDVSLVESSNFKIYQFPTPYLVINEINHKKNITLKNIKVGFSLLSLMKFSPKVNSLEIGEVILHLDNDDVNLLSHDEFISEMIFKDALSIKATINKLTFVESDHDVPLEIKNFVFESNSDKTVFSGRADDVGKLYGSFIKNPSFIFISTLLLG